MVFFVVLRQASSFCSQKILVRVLTVVYVRVRTLYQRTAKRDILKMLRRICWDNCMYWSYILWYTNSFTWGRCTSACVLYFLIVLKLSHCFCSIQFNSIQYIYSNLKHNNNGKNISNNNDSDQYTRAGLHLSPYN